MVENLLLISCAPSVDGDHMKWHRKLAREHLFYAVRRVELFLVFQLATVSNDRNNKESK